MNAFQEFRHWASGAPAGERGLSAVAAVVVLAAVALLLVPESDAGGEARAALDVAAGSETQATATGTANATATESESSEAGPDLVAAPPSSSATVSDTPGRPAAAGGPAGRACPRASGNQGVTDTEIEVAIILIDLVGPVANNAFGLPDAAEQRADYEAVAEDLNKRGVACRKLVLEFFTVNPTDPSGQQEQCLAIADTEPFVVIDPGGYDQSAAQVCFPRNELPYLGFTLRDEDISRFFPYFFALSNVDLTNRNGILGLRSLGFFDAAAGFRKLGFIYRGCFPRSIEAMRAAMREAGVGDEQVVTYDVGCPSTFATPADLQQAVLTFQRAGVTHVTTAFFLADFANFTRVAQQQQFKPRYGLSDDGIVSSAGGALAPDPRNIDGAIDITSGRYGEHTTPGITPSPGTQRCNALYAAKGRPPVYEHQSGFGGRACSQLWMVAAALDRAPRLERTALADGLHAAESAELSFPNGPGDFRRAPVTYAGQFWRPLRFEAGCECWRVADPTFRPSFPAARA